MSKSVHQLFDEACDLAADERDSFLARACEGKTELREEVESLLEAFDGAGDFLKDPSIDSASAFTAQVDLQEGDVVERYRILEKIGEGSNAVVFMVEQLKPIRRRAAMKVIKLGMDTKEVIARFEAERQALAMMDHPNIAKVFDAGTTANGRPFFIMELVKGIPITAYCDKNKLANDERLQLFQQVCLALQHAHLKGIIHRDVKPSNVLVTLHDGTPVPKVIDFGIAKATETQLTEKTLFTRFHQFIGTPAYMSPEQAEMSGLDVDTRTDVYSLGILLYELLTGSTPFDGKQLLDSGYAAIQRTIREKMPAMPSTRVSTIRSEGLTALAGNRSIDTTSLKRQLQGDLDWIVMKALEKDRTRRYETAGEFARDIRRFLNTEPVSASPPSKTYLLRKFVQRHRSLVFSGLLILAVLVGSLIAAAFLWQRAERQAEVARSQAEKADSVTHFLETMFQSAGPDSARGADFTVRELLDEFGERFSSQVDLEPETEMSVRQVVSSAYEGLGDFLKAEPHARRALEISQSLFGPDSVEAAKASSQFAWLSYHVGDREGGLAKLEEAAEKLKDAGMVDQETSCRLASVLVEQGDLARAEALVIQVRSSDSGDMDLVSLWSGQLLADIYQRQGRFSEARRLLTGLSKGTVDQKEGLRVRPQNLEAIHTLAQLELAEGRVAQAGALVSEGGELSARILGENHRLSLLLEVDRVMVIERQGNLGLATGKLREILARQRARLGDYHQDTLRSILLLSRYELQLGASVEAAQLAQLAHGIARNAFGDSHEQTLRTLRNYIGVIVREGRINDARELLTKSLNDTEQVLGVEHPEAMEGLRLLVANESLYGSQKNAQRLHQSLIARYSKLKGDESRDTQVARLSYAQFLQRSGQFGRAKAECQTLLRICRSKGFKGELIQGLTELARIERSRNCELAARPHLAEALTLCGNFYGTDHEYTHEVNLERMRNLVSRRDFEEAARWAEDVLNRDSNWKAIPELHQQLNDLKVEATRRYQEASKGAADAQRGYDALWVKSVVSKKSRAERYEERVVLLRILRHLPSQKESTMELVEEHIQETERLYPENRWLKDQAQFLKAQLLLSFGEAERAEAVFDAVVESYLSEENWKKANSAGQFVQLIRLLMTTGQEGRRDELVNTWQDELTKTVWPEQAVNVLVPRGSEWSHRTFRYGLSREWRNQTSADLGSDWQSVLAPIGIGMPGLNTLLPTPENFSHIDSFHCEFEVVAPEDYQRLKIRLLRDDAAIVSLNGKEVHLDNVSRTAAGVGRAKRNSTNINQVSYHVSTISPKHLITGRNVLSVELIQHGSVADQAIFDLQLEGLRETRSAK